MEYNTPVWSPYLAKDISRIESIQRLFTRRACLRCGVYFRSYEDRLEKLNLDSLEKRRQLTDLYLMYKILNNLCSIPFNTYFSLINSPYILRRNSLQICYKYNTKHKNLQWSNIFFNRIVKVWNGLPDSVVTAPNLGTFKSRLSRVKNQFWFVHPILAIVVWHCCLHVYRTVAVHFCAYLFDYFLTAFLLLCTSREESYMFQLFHIVFISSHFKSPLCFDASGICVAR